MLAEELIPLHLQEDILPICPCGCDSLPAQDPEDIPDYARSNYNKWKWTWLQTERNIIRIRQFPETELIHHMRHIRCLMPWVTHDPQLVRLVKIGLQVKSEGLKIMSMMGHASSGKTNYIVVRGFQSIDIWPEHSEVFVAAPTKTAGHYLLWNEFDKAYFRFRDYGYKIFKRGNVISINNNTAGVGTISFVGLQNVGTMRGKKMIDANVGELMVAMDEVGEFPNDAMLDILANLKSQKGLQTITGTNFRHLHGLDGRFHEPRDCEWGDLSQETDYQWYTALNGISVRIRAKTSANVVMGVDYYPYLLTKSAHEELLAYGETSPDYMAQGDAFPCIESVGRNIITTNEISSAGTYEDVQLLGEEQFSFLDPSFTYGGDAAMAVILSLGRIQNGEQKIRCIKMERLNVSENLLWDEEMLDLALQFRNGKPLKEGTILGDRISAFDLCALMYGKFLRANGVEPRNSSYDDSMRGVLVHAMTFYLGEALIPCYYGGGADTRIAFPLRTKWLSGHRRKPTKVPMTNADLHQKYVSQMWFTAANLIRAGYLRNGFMMEGAFGEMKKRLKLIQVGKKEDIEPKADYKKRHHRSPDKADALCGGLNLISERRLAPTLDTSNFSDGDTAAVINMLMSVERESTALIPALSR